MLRMVFAELALLCLVLIRSRSNATNLLKVLSESECEITTFRYNATNVYFIYLRQWQNEDYHINLWICNDEQRVELRKIIQADSYCRNATSLLRLFCNQTSQEKRFGPSQNTTHTTFRTDKRLWPAMMEIGKTALAIISLFLIPAYIFTCVWYQKRYKTFNKCCPKYTTYESKITFERYSYTSIPQERYCYRPIPNYYSARSLQDSATSSTVPLTIHFNDEKIVNNREEKIDCNLGHDIAKDQITGVLLADTVSEHNSKTSSDETRSDSQELDVAKVNDKPPYVAHFDPEHKDGIHSSLMPDPVFVEIIQELDNYIKTLEHHIKKPSAHVANVEDNSPRIAHFDPECNNSDSSTPMPNLVLDNYYNFLEHHIKTPSVALPNPIHDSKADSDHGNDFVNDQIGAANNDGTTFSIAFFDPVCASHIQELANTDQSVPVQDSSSFRDQEITSGRTDEIALWDQSVGQASGLSQSIQNDERRSNCESSEESDISFHTVSYPSAASLSSESSGYAGGSVPYDTD